MDLNWADLIIAFPLSIALAWVMYRVFSMVFAENKQIREQSNQREIDTITAMNDITDAIQRNTEAIRELQSFHKKG